MSWIPREAWDASIGRSGNRLVLSYDPDLGAIAAVIAPDGTVLSTGAATERHINHDCLILPIEKP